MCFQFTTAANHLLLTVNRETFIKLRNKPLIESSYSYHE